MDEMKVLDQALNDGRLLDQKAKNLKKLKGQLDIATQAVDDYKKLVTETKSMILTLDGERAKLDAAAAVYMKNSADFLDSQNKAFKVDLNERQTKIRLVSSLADIGASARVTNFKAQATNDSRLLQEAIDKINQVYPLLDDLRKVTRDSEDIRRIDQTEAAAKGYQAAIRDFMKEFRKGSKQSN